jgi:hypothetical protein
LNEAPPHAGLYRRATAAALVGAPLLFLIDNLIHPKEYARDNEVKQLGEIADHYTAWQLAHFIGFLAILGFVVAVLGLAFLVRRRRPGAGLAGGALAMLGLMCFAAIIALDGFAWGILGEVSARTSDTRVTTEALNDLQQSEWSLQFYVPALAFAAGMASLGIVAARSGAVRPVAGYLLALGAVLVGTEGLIVSNAYYVFGSLVMLAGGAATALSIWRMSDAAFANGGEEPPEEAGEEDPAKQIVLP